jgi:hypothetical protein
MQRLREGLRLRSGPIEIYLRDAKTLRLLDYGQTHNLILDQCLATLLQRLFGVAGSVRSISQIGIGTGSTAPDASDTGLEAEVLIKDIDTVDQAGEASDPPSRVCEVTFDSGEANGAGTSLIKELGFVFDDDTYVSRALFGQGLITDVTLTDPVVVESEDHGLSLGQQVYIEGVGGTVEVNDTLFTVGSVTTDTFELGGIDGTGYTIYTSGGKWTRTFEKQSGRILQVHYPFGFA